MNIRSSIRARFSLATILVVCVLMIISAVFMYELNQIERTLAKSTNELIANIQTNSEITRKVYQLTSRIQLLEQTYLYDAEVLQEENLLVDQKLQEIKALSKDPEFLVNMDSLIRSFHRFLGNSLSLNNILQERNEFDRKLAGSIGDLGLTILLSETEKPEEEKDGGFFDNLKVMQYLEIRDSLGRALISSASVRSRITADTEQVVLIELEKELDILRFNLLNLNQIDINLSEYTAKPIKLVSRYMRMIKRMRISLRERWKIMNELVSDQENLSVYTAKNEDRMSAGTRKIQESLGDEIHLFRVLILLSSAVTVFLSFFLFKELIRRDINQPIESITENIKGFGAGKNSNLIRLNRSDEWLTIESAFNQMVKNLDESYRAIDSERKKFNYIAHHDPLTGLTNRLFAYEELGRLIEGHDAEDPGFSLVYMDLDEFKQVNDSLGHGAGDQLLSEAAALLLEEVGEAGQVSRLGGDEFMLILPRKESPVSAVEFAQKISDVLRNPILLGDQAVIVGSSMGICHYPEHGKSVDALVRNADTAMYQAKKAGKNRVCVYEHSMTDDARDFLSLTSGIRRALKDDEFFLVYQPQYNMKTGEINGLEALIRWHSRETGIIFPDRFLPVAEQSGLISEIDNWVFKTVCEQVVSWLDAGVINNDMKVALNFSGRKFIEPGLDKYLAKTLALTGCDASIIQIEITEQDVMTQVEDRHVIMQQLKGLGFSLAIDDFGTGYSSFNYLKNLPVDTLKIDRSFIMDIDRNPRDMAIVHTIISLAQILGLDVVAEGIETGVHAELLIENGCNSGQGYYFSKPLPLDEVELMLGGVNNIRAQQKS